MQQGGVSKATKTLNLSEEKGNIWIFGGRWQVVQKITSHQTSTHAILLRYGVLYDVVAGLPSWE